MNTQLTSELARQKSMDFKEKHHAKIINVLNQKSDLTYKQIAKYSGLEAVGVARRLSELVRAEKIEITGRKKCPIANSLCHTYAIKDTKLN